MYPPVSSNVAGTSALNGGLIAGKIIYDGLPPSVFDLPEGSIDDNTWILLNGLS